SKFSLFEIPHTIRPAVLYVADYDSLKALCLRGCFCLPSFWRNEACNLSPKTNEVFKRKRVACKQNLIRRKEHFLSFYSAFMHGCFVACKRVVCLGFTPKGRRCTTLG